MITYQNMKNFYEAITTDLSCMLRINITLQPIHYDQNKMSCVVYINDTEIYNDTPTDKVTITHTSDLLSPLIFKFIMNGKQPNDTCDIGDVAILIETITINDHNMMLYFDQNATYISNNQLIKSSCYMGFNGTQTFTIDKPFYQWLHLANPWGWIA